MWVPESSLENRRRKERKKIYLVEKVKKKKKVSNNEEPLSISTHQFVKYQFHDNVCCNSYLWKATLYENRYEDEYLTKNNLMKYKRRLISKL